MSQKEIWKDILNYEGLYQISNLGNVKSLERTHKIYNYKKKEKVNQYSLNGELIKQWDSLTDIYNELGYSWGNISGCCRKVRKTSNGYRWEYAEVQ